MVVREIEARSALVKSRLPGTDYVVNPYLGCAHACIYCYARFMVRFAPRDEAWGCFVDAKTNIADLIPKGTDRYRGKRVFVSSVTDPYQPVERKLGLTREVLKRLAPLGVALGVQSKSDLILRDMDILTDFDSPEIGLTITTLDDSVRRGIERAAAPVSARLEALRRLKEKGFRTYAFIGPVLPGLTDWRAIVEATRASCDFYYFENLNPTSGVGGDVMGWIAENQPEHHETCRQALRSPREFWDPVEADITRYCAVEGIEARLVFHHGKRKSSPLR